MIGMLTGSIMLRQDPYLIIDVHGVGYKVLAAQNVFANKQIGDTVTVYTHTHVREDVLELYGFAELADLQLFERLISVSGVGCKSALGIFTVGSREEIVSAILRDDSTFFTTVPRLGKKNAQKIIIELKGKLETGSGVDAPDIQGGGTEVVDALRGFGFSTREAQEALQSLKGQGETTAEKIRLALKYLGK